MTKLINLFFLITLTLKHSNLVDLLILLYRLFVKSQRNNLQKEGGALNAGGRYGKLDQTCPFVLVSLLFRVSLLGQVK